MKKQIQYGYVRVSTKDQNEDRQYIALEEFGIQRQNIFQDRMSGKNFDRPQYRKLVHYKLKRGDLLVVKSIDRLGRNYSEILDEWRYITKKKGADVVVLDMPILDTRSGKDLIGTLIADIVLQILSFVAENEREMIKQRQAEGIAAARARGVHLGRYPSPVPEEFAHVYWKWRNKEITSQEGKELCEVSLRSFYRLVQKYEQLHGLARA